MKVINPKKLQGYVCSRFTRNAPSENAYTKITNCQHFSFSVSNKEISPIQILYSESTKKFRLCKWPMVLTSDGKNWINNAVYVFDSLEEAIEADKEILATIEPLICGKR